MQEPMTKANAPIAGAGVGAEELVVGTAEVAADGADSLEEAETVAVLKSMRETRGSEEEEEEEAVVEEAAAEVVLGGAGPDETELVVAVAASTAAVEAADAGSRAAGGGAMYTDLSVDGPRYC